MHVLKSKRKELMRLFNELETTTKPVWDLPTRYDLSQILLERP